VTTAAADFTDTGASQIRSPSEWHTENNGPADLTLRADYSPKAFADPKAADWSVYSFLVGAAQRVEDSSRIDRIGLGGHRRFGRWGRLSGEVSTGNGSLNTQAGGSCQINDRIQLYSKSVFDSQRTDGTFAGLGGTLTNGARLRASEKAGIFGEERIQLSGGLSKLTHVFGFDLRPAPGWTWETNLEIRDPGDPYAGRLQDRVGRISVVYVRNDIRYGGHLEWHLEDGGDPTRNAGWKVHNDVAFPMGNGWNLRGGLNASFCPPDDDFPSNAVGVECLSELAHKPSGRNSFGMLIKYTLPAKDGGWPSGIEGSLYASINPTMRVRLGYNTHHFSSAVAAPIPDGQRCFLEFAGAF
jgi:hypothetical protein